MPLGFKHSNRSHSQQLDSPQAQRPLSGPLAQAQPVSASAVNDKAFDPKAPQPQPYAETHNNPEQHYLQTPIDHQSGSGTYQELEARGEVQPVPQSHRHSRFLFHQPHQQQPQSGEVSQGSNPINASQQELRRQLLQNQGYSAGSSSVPATPVQPPEKSKARGFFGKFTSKSQRDKVHQAQQPHQSTLQNLGRSVSKRQSKQPEIRTHQNNSIERLQQSEWQQSQGSSSGTLSSPQDLDKDDYDPYQVREDQVEHHQQQQQYIPPPQLSVRVVHDQHQEPQAQQYQQYQDQQHLQSPQQYSPLQYQQLGQQVSADNSGDVDYDPSTMPSQQSGYQQNINYPGQSAYRQQNPEVVSQTSHESPVDQIDERPPSVHSSRGYQQQQQYPSRTTSIVDPSRPNKAPPQLQQQSSMGPPPQAAGAQGRKSIETSNKNIQASDNRGPPPGYSQGQFPPPPAGAQNVNLQSPLPPIPGQQQQPQTGYRGTQLRQELSGVTEGRSTPPPPENKDNMSEYDKLFDKYKKVKRLYFEKTTQVESLQNTLANQRLSQSRTSLDDSEYLTRFQRLDGAIKEVAFSVRKDWSSMPAWITPYVNRDAMRTGTKEMTAVGRAVISHWVYNEIWGRCFHPGLDPPLREELKVIEGNLRFYSPNASNLEDNEALTAKIVQWRLTTIEGLAHRLKGSAAHEAMANFVQLCVGNLTAHLLQHLSESAAMNIQGNATSIVELAVGIAQHIPQESRDIVISYPQPQDALLSNMRVEAALPPLESYFAIPDNTADENGASSKEDVNTKEGKDAKGKKLEKNKGKKAPEGSAGAPTQEQLQEVERKKVEAKERIRFAGFVMVEVRGRQVLYHPPVWTIA